MDQTPPWELSKENIQPLRSGRKASAMAVNSSSGNVSLGTAASDTYNASIVEREKEIREKKTAFEAEIRTFAGSDRLAPWMDYISWTEQTFPKGGKEANLCKLMEKCILEFKDNQDWNQDPRYLNVWMKYANLSPKPLEIYNYLNSEGLGLALPDLYINWAWHLEQARDFDKARKVFTRGLENMKDEADHKCLERQWHLFQARAMKSLLETEDQDEPVPPTEDERAVLGSLRGHGKHQKVGSVRVGHAKKAEGPGVYTAGASAAARETNGNHFAIYKESSDENADKALLASGSARSMPINPQQNQENELKPGKWSSASIGRKTQAVPFDQVQIKPTFNIHLDENLAQKPVAQTVKVGDAQVLSSRKVEPQAALAVFKTSETDERSMYCKHLIYQGTTEFSFEELRAIRFRKKLEEQQLEQKRTELAEREREIREQAESLLREKEAFLRQMQDEAERRQQQFERMQREALMQQQDEFKKMKEELALMAATRMRQQVSVDEDHQRSSKQTSSVETSSIEDTALLLKANPMDGKPMQGRSHRSPVRETASGFAQLSPTVNTKEAMNMMQNMWLKSDATVDDTDNAPAPAQKTSSALPFKIYSDASEKDENKENKSIQSTSAKAPPAFAIFCDAPQEAAPSDKPKLSSGLKVRAEPPVQRLSSEEMPPPSMPVKAQAKKPVPNMTMVVPSEEDFDMMAQRMSTPCHGRQFIPDFDENTCAIEIITKRFPAPQIEERAESEPESDAFTAPAPEAIKPALSPIMETSREMYRSSSTSSGHSISCQLTKSHWGNSHLAGASGPHQPVHLPTSERRFGLTAKLTNEISCSSGYMGDSSSARTPGLFLGGAFKIPEEETSVKKRQPSNPIAKPRAPFGFNADLIDEEDDGDEDVTESVKNVFRNYKRDVKLMANSSVRDNLTVPSSNVSAVKSSFLEESLREDHSFLQKSAARNPQHSFLLSSQMQNSFADQQDLSNFNFGTPEPASRSTSFRPTRDS